MINFTAKVIFFLLLSILSSHATECFDTQTEHAKNTDHLKAMLICSNPETLSDCHDIFHKQKSYTPTESSKIACHSSKHKIASAQPVPLPLLASLSLLEHKISLNPRRKFVNSVVDFHHHTQMHKKRVTALALELYKKFPKQFTGLSEEMIIRVISQHDDAKINPKYRFKGKIPLYEALYKYYGKRPPKEVIDSLNAVDEKIVDMALKREGFEILDTDTEARKRHKLKVRKQFLKLEKLADFVDRAMNPVSSEEFGRKMWKESDAAKTPMHKKMALYLEKNYTKMVGHLKYKKLTPSMYYKLAQKIKLDKSFKALLNTGRTTKELGARVLTNTSKLFTPAVRSVGGKILTGASITLNSILMAGYSESIDCSSMLGFHDWEIKDGACVPKYGMTEKIVSYLNMPESVQKDYLSQGKHLCKILKKNEDFSQSKIFTKVTCSPKGAIMEFAPNKNLDVKFDFEGRINQIKLNNIREYIPGLIGTSYTTINFKNNGQIENLCFKTHNGSRKHCKVHKEDALLSKTQNVVNMFYSMNYKIQQAISCCMGKKTEYSQNTICSI